MFKVLVVEDNVLIRLTIVDALREAGFEVLEAGTAEDAINMMNEDTIHLLFTDIQLPGKLTGIDVAHAVTKRFPDAGIIVVSGRLSPKDIALPSGAEFFAKPYSSDTIVARLNVMIQR